MKHENLGLVTTRQTREPFAALAVDKICGQHKIVAKYDGSYVFPLYLYSDAAKKDLLSNLEPGRGRKPNLNSRLLEALAAAYGCELTPEEIFHYIYAVLYAPTYRQQYAEFLRLDFPRIPFTTDSKIFQALAGLGERLAALHLLKSPDLDPPAARFEGQGDGRVAKSKSQGLRYDAEAQRVYVNQTQYFAPVPAEVWEYQVGGYQVCEKWLKDRKERRLDLDEIRTYCRIVTAFKHTTEIQEEIDGLYPAAESETISLLDKSSETGAPAEQGAAADARLSRR